LLIVACFIGAGVVAYLQLRPDSGGDLELPPQPVVELSAATCADGDWPWWRGPSRDNHSPDAAAPTSWTEKENVVWKTALPGRGHSSPILVGKRIFVTAADESAKRQVAICLDRSSGEILWEKTIHENNFPGKHPDNSFASGTPASDGERLFVVFPNDKAIRVSALDLDGKILWQTEAGPNAVSGTHGSGTSPALWGSLIFVSDESPGRGWVAALHRQTGEIAWRKDRKTSTGSYGSPVTAEFDGKPRLLLAGSGRVTAYEPATGVILWDRDGLADVCANTAAFGPSLIFACSGFPQRKLVALRPDGTVAWKKDSGNEIPYPPSLLWHGDHLFAVSDQGLAACWDAANGNQLWKERLEGSYYSSPLLVGKQIYACSREGMTTIFDASPDGLTVVATNKLSGAINASPVAVGGKLYLRTVSHLYCIGKP
jgi:outer membrane protein assembly factor BamB